MNKWNIIHIFMKWLKSHVKNILICYESESYKKQQENLLYMQNNGNENRGVWPNGLLDDFEINMMRRYVQYLKSDWLPWEFQNCFGP